MLKISILVTLNEFQQYQNNYKQIFNLSNTHIYETSYACSIITDVLHIYILSIDTPQLEPTLARLGRIHAIGLTREAKMKLSDEILKYIIEPMCNIKIIG